MGEESGDGNFSRLPEGCVSHVLYLTTPRDACRSSAVSATFRSAACSDVVWERFLPSDYERILSRAVDPVGPFASKRELYFRLCEPLLLDGGNTSFSLEKGSGKKCYMLSARELVIEWGDDPQYWGWFPLSGSRFAEVAELLSVCWLDVTGKIDCKVLSPKTTYAAYLIFKLTPEAYGLHGQKALVTVGTHVSEHDVCLQFDDDADDNGEDDGAWNFVGRRPERRGDQWMEMELGVFFNDEGDDGEVFMCLKQVIELNWKGGLIIQGIEVRPKE